MPSFSANGDKAISIVRFPVAVAEEASILALWQVVYPR